MKKLLVSNFIILICFSAFMLGYSSLEGISFADSDIQWENCTTASEQAEAFKAYCKSRDLTIEGSLADGVTSFTTQTYQNLITTLGLDVNALQADIKKATDSNGAVKYLFNASGISAMNRVFSQFLQDHDLQEGDEASEEDNTVYSGYIFYDDEGNSCLAFVVDNTFSYNAVTNNSTYESHILQYGTYLKYNSSDLVSAYGTSPYIKAKDYTYSIPLYFTYNCYSFVTGSTFSQGLIRGATTPNGNVTYTGYGYTICYLRLINGEPTNWYIGRYSKATGIYTSNGSYIYSGSLQPLSSNKVLNDPVVYPCNVYIYSPTINNNDYSNNTYTVINNDGDVYNYDTDDEPDPDAPVTPPSPDDPSGGTPPDDWDIELPDLSNTDWVIYGLEKKFPWDIPFNMMFILSLLNAEPVTPHFEGSIDLKVCTWDYDLDLSPFDTIAGYVREFMFLSFIIGLMLMTKNLIWG